MSRVTKLAAFVCVLCFVCGASAFADARPYYDWAQWTVPNGDMEAGSGTNPQGEIGWYNALGDTTFESNYSCSYQNVNDMLTDWGIYPTNFVFGGRWNPSDANYPGATDPPGDPSPMEGPQVAMFHWGQNVVTNDARQRSYASITTINTETDYTAEVAVGTPIMTAGADPVDPVTKNSLSILAGGTTIAENNRSPGPTAGTWVNRSTSVSYTVAGAYAGQGLNLELWAKCDSDNKLHVDFDNLRLYEHRLAIEGDANLDELVDISDFFVLKTNFDLDPATWGHGNFNDDTIVDISDFFILKTHFDEKYSDTVPGIGSMPRFTAIPPAGGGAAGAAPTPEPATIGLLALGGLALLRRRRG